MTLQNVLAEVFKFGRSIRAMAALGAELRLRKEGADGDPQVRALLQDVVRAMDPSLLDGLNAEEQSAVLGIVLILFRDANDLLEKPGSAPGWTYTDTAPLEAQGRASRVNVSVIDALASKRPAIAAVIQEPGAFLDVGTGVGHLAIEAARTWTSLRVIGIDILEPALALARVNVAAMEVADRIELRTQSIIDLADKDFYSMAWLPVSFIPRDTFRPALRNLYEALKPGGWLVVGQFGIPDEPLANALARLQIVRSGGYPRQISDIVEMMRACGYEQVESLPGPAGGDFIIGRRPKS